MFTSLSKLAQATSKYRAGLVGLALADTYLTYDLIAEALPQQPDLVYWYMFRSVVVLVVVGLFLKGGSPVGKA